MMQNPPKKYGDYRDTIAALLAVVYAAEEAERKAVTDEDRAVYAARITEAGGQIGRVEYDTSERFCAGLRCVLKHHRQYILTLLADVFAEAVDGEVAALRSETRRLQKKCDGQQKVLEELAGQLKQLRRGHAK